MYVEAQPASGGGGEEGGGTGTGTWHVSWRDCSPSGHDKAESMRRALSSAKNGGTATVLVGQTACDFAPVAAGMVDTLYAPVGCALEGACRRAGVVHCEFVGWDALQSTLLPADLPP